MENEFDIALSPLQANILGWALIAFIIVATVLLVAMLVILIKAAKDYLSHPEALKRGSN